MTDDKYLYLKSKEKETSGTGNKENRRFTEYCIVFYNCKIVYSIKKNSMSGKRGLHKRGGSLTEFSFQQEDI